MRKKTKMKRNFRLKGMTLIEIMIAIIVVMIVVTGIMSYRYYSALDAKKAEVRATAGRISLLLLEGWKGLQGDTAYDPEVMFSSQIAISETVDGPELPTDFSGVLFNLLGYYETVVDGVYYYSTLAYRDETASEPQILNIATVWRHDYSEGIVSETDKSVKLTTYTDYK